MINRQSILFSLTLKSFVFRPNLIATLFVVPAFALLFKLGLWQIDRAHQKNLMIEQFNAQQKATPQHLGDIQPLPASQYTPIEITGLVDNPHTYLLDNRSYQHKAGYEVLSPFFTTDSKVVLINRGFIERGPDRRVLPTIPPIVGKVTLRGIVYQPSKAFVLSHKTEYPTQWPQIIQSIDFNTLSDELHYALLPFTVLVEAGITLYPRNWTVTATPATKNYGYALQWFSFSIILLIIYLYTNSFRKAP